MVEFNLTTIFDDVVPFVAGFTCPPELELQTVVIVVVVVVVAAAAGPAVGAISKRCLSGEIK